MATGRNFSTRVLSRHAMPMSNAAWHRASTARRFVQFAFVASLATMLAAGCSRLSGDHEADRDEEQAAKMERLLDDAPESLRARKDKATVESRGERLSATVSDGGDKTTARPAAAEFSKPTTAKPTSVARPATRSRPMRTPAANKADEIPDAAEIGL